MSIVTFLTGVVGILLICFRMLVILVVVVDAVDDIEAPEKILYLFIEVYLAYNIKIKKSIITGL